MDDFTFRSISSAYIHWKYFWLLIFPYELSCDYSLNCIPMISNWDDFRIILPIGFYCFLFLSFLYGILMFSNKVPEITKKLGKCYFISWGFLIITFIPASNIFVYVGTLIGERLLYIPSIGFCYLFSLFWFYLDRKFSSKYQFIRYIIFVLVIIWFIFLASKTYDRNFDWENDETLFRSAEKVCNNSAKVQEV